MSTVVYDDSADCGGADIVICGPGRVGTSLVLSFVPAGFRVQVVDPYRAMKLTGTAGVQVDVRTNTADVVLSDRPAVWIVCVPDAAVISVVCSLFASPSAFRADFDYCAVVSATSDISEITRCPGVVAHRVCRAHPLYPFPPPESATALPPGTPFAVENAAPPVLEVLKRIGGLPFELDPNKRHLYHAAAVLVSNLPGALWFAAGRILAGCGVPSAEDHAGRMLSGLAASIAVSGHNALPGPAARGDIETVACDQQALDRYNSDIARVHQILSEVIAFEIFEHGRSRRDI
jgi:predicted short-subunit dehydrogenase-like oxidoreductase (DUF2520 family)